MVVGLRVQLQGVARRVVEFRRENVLVTVIEGLIDQFGLGEIQFCRGVFQQRAESQRVAKIVGAFATHFEQVVGAIPVRIAGLDLIAREG